MAIVVEKHGMLFMAVPKAASSSVKAMLAQIDPDVTLPEPHLLTESTYHGIYQTRRFRPHRFAQYDGYLRFTVIRDPLRRLLSVYTNRVVGMKELHNSRKLRRRGVLPLDPDPDTFFLNLDQYMQLASVIRHHVLPTRLFTGPDLSVYDHVFKTDQIDDVARMLSDKSGFALRPSNVNVSKARLLFSDLAPATRDALRPVIEPEYDLLGDYFDNPFD
jgi:hypothetical protein